MNNILPKILTSILLFVASLSLAGKAYAAPKLYFNPETIATTKDSQFTVTIGIDVESQQSFGADAVISYAGADLEVVNVASGNFFPQFNQANTTAGTLELHSYFSSLYESRSGSGTFATITFKAKKDSGSSTISFTCGGSGTDTQILNTAGTNILTCSVLNTVAVTYAGTSPTGTLTPTPTLPAGISPTPTQIPGNNTVPVCASLAANVTSGVGTPLAITFTCSGVDPDGDITAAEFSFGDRTTHTVYKNVGSPGSLSTTHTYTTIGSLGATCRVRDNNQVWSSVSEGCKKIIQISPAAKKIAATLTPRISPAPVAADIIPETPSPTPWPELSPTQEPEKPEDTSGKNPWVIVAILAVAGGIILLLLRRKKSPPQAPPPPPSAPMTTEYQPPPPAPPITESPPPTPPSV